MKPVLTIFFTIFMVTPSLFAETCPQTHGEASACALENGKVQSSLKGLRASMMMKFCGVNPPHERACRAVVRYKNTAGVLSENIFEEWFVANPGKSDEAQYRSFMVRNSNGQYDSYWVDNFDGGPMDEFEINFSDPRQKSVDVQFNGLFPTYDFHYNAVSGKPPVRAIFSYSLDAVKIQKYDSGGEGLLEKLVYQLESIQKLD